MRTRNLLSKKAIITSLSSIFFKASNAIASPAAQTWNYADSSVSEVDPVAGTVILIGFIIGVFIALRESDQINLKTVIAVTVIGSITSGLLLLVTFPAIMLVHYLFR